MTDRTVDDDARRRVAVVERRRVDQRLERRAGLAARLRRAIELALGEAEAADDREDAAGMRIHGDQRAADLRHLLERPLTLHAFRIAGVAVLVLFRLARRNIDHVARLEHLRSSTPGLPPRPRCSLGRAHFTSSKGMTPVSRSSDERTCDVRVRGAGRRSPCPWRHRARRPSAKDRYPTKPGWRRASCPNRRRGRSCFSGPRQPPRRWS